MPTGSILFWQCGSVGKWFRGSNENGARGQRASVFPGTMRAEAVVPRLSSALAAPSSPLARFRHPRCHPRAFSHTPSSAPPPARLIIVICFWVIWDYSHQKEYKSNGNSPPFVTFNTQTLRFTQIKLYLCTRIFILNTYLSWQDLSRRPLSSMVKMLDASRHVCRSGIVFRPKNGLK